MSKFGWSYPPGVTESMLPGNSKEEREQEEMMDLIYSALDPLRKFWKGDGAEQAEDVVATAIEKIVSNAYAKGRGEGIHDEALANEYRIAEEIKRRDAFLKHKGLAAEYLAWQTDDDFVQRNLHSPKE